MVPPASPARKKSWVASANVLRRIRITTPRRAGARAARADCWISRSRGPSARRVSMRMRGAAADTREARAAHARRAASRMNSSPCDPRASMAAGVEAVDDPSRSGGEASSSFTTMRMAWNARSPRGAPRPARRRPRQLGRRRNSLTSRAGDRARPAAPGLTDRAATRSARSVPASARRRVALSHAHVSGPCPCAAALALIDLQARMPGRGEVRRLSPQTRR
jgi:hypothetical protein